MSARAVMDESDPDHPVVVMSDEDRAEFGERQRALDAEWRQRAMWFLERNSAALWPAPK